MGSFFYTISKGGAPMEDGKKALSLCMIVKNEEQNLARCLESVKGLVDEIIIIDTGSSDQTKNIAARYTDRVYDFHWQEDFSAARNYSSSFAKGEWILVLDADDELEQEDKNLLLKLLKDIEVEAFFFPTISFVGDSPGPDTVINMNLRLFRNFKGYSYSGRIHEQIASNIINVNPKAKMRTENIRIYHYGYISKEVKVKEKRIRNKKILNIMLQENNEDSFVLFNLGNEYFASNDYKTALEFYLSSLNKITDNCGYESKLLLRIVLCLIDLREVEKSLEYIEGGLEKFTEQTDFLFLKGVILKNNHQYNAAIECFKQCIKMGEAPIYLRFVEGVGSFKSYYCLGDIYFELKKYDVAFEAYVEAVKYSINYERALEKMIITALHLTTLERAVKMVEAVLSPINSQGAYHLSKAFYKLRKYSLAQFYIEKVRETDITRESTLLQGKVYFHRGLFEKSKGIFGKIWESGKENIEYLLLYLLSHLLNDEFNGVDKILMQFKDADENKYYYQTACAFVSILLGVEEKKILSEDSIVSAQYTKIIFDLLRLLLEVRSYNYFDRALGLLNLINDNSVLLKLGKLYYSYGYLALAEGEIIRSMKLFNICDEEGEKILQEIYREK